MELFRIKRDIPFMRHALVFNIISLATFVLAVIFLIAKGLHFNIEFTGGSVIELQYATPPAIDQVRAKIEKLGFGEASVQTFGSEKDILVRLANKEGVGTADIGEKVLAAVCEGRAAATPPPAQPAGDQPAGEKPAAGKPAAASNAGRCGAGADEIIRKRVESVGSQVGKELAHDGLLALLLVSLGIVAYLAVRFEWRFAVAAIIANLHDVVIILGFFALFQWEFSLPVLAAVLAVLGYSVNESVVIADRIRENFKSPKMRKATVSEVIDNAITSTISRTIITHGCTQLMVTSMLIFGGETLHYFALALTIGILFGIYSSVLVMAPLVRWLGVSREDLIKPEKKVVEAEQVHP